MSAHLRAAWAALGSRTAMPMNPPEDLVFMGYYPKTLEDGNPGIAAIVGREAVGILTIRVSLFAGVPHRTDLLYVKPAWRRRGIGTLLFRRLQELFPGVAMSGHRSDAGEAWVNSEVVGIDPGPRTEMFDQADAETIGAEVLAKVQRDVP